MPKQPKKKSAKNPHQPLGQEILSAQLASKYARPSKKSSSNPTTSRNGDSDDDEEEEPFMSEKDSAKIVNMAREQQEEEESSNNVKITFDDDDQGVNKPRRKVKYEDDSDSDSESDAESIEMDEEEFLKATEDGGYVSVSMGLGPGEEEIISKLMGGGDQGTRRTLADMIMEKISEKESNMNVTSGDGDAPSDEDSAAQPSPFPPKVVEVYTSIGQILSRYTAGKLPKAFKVIPSLTEWEEILYLTRPDKWTPQAMYSATKIFASNLNPRMAQRFFNLVLLDAVRADIQSNKKLNYHYYAALKKSLYKPAAFFKGILLPLCMNNCTLREAAIVSSILSKVSIPLSHSAVALHKICGMEYSGGQAVFIRTLLDKKYSLPVVVIKAVVEYFLKPLRAAEKARKEGRRLGEGELPVLWHQALLVFCQRYKGSLTEEEKEGIRRLTKVENHRQITREVRRELFGVKGYKMGDGDDEEEGGEGAGAMSLS
ncbi:hypothetical protein TrST_g13732 [Triparma strigata]|uniref:Bystin n=1 Tax=Triparma strigata TaxID=1606541 RepID=A0A9W7BMI3_9STRA|nr:hypothetical protein TrST_g13732 [Triparma strigata]